MAHGLPSNKRINRLGQLLAVRAEAARHGDQGTLCALDQAELHEAERVVDLWRASHAYPLTKASANLRYYGRNHDGARPTQRLKKHSTMVDKLRREPRMKLTTMEDVGGCRLVLPDPAAEDGYRARHLIAVKIAVKAPRRIEIQLRTPLQDLWANSVERVGRDVADELKSGGGPRELREYYRVIAEALEAEDHGRSVDDALIERVRQATNRMRAATVDS